MPYHLLLSRLLIFALSCCCAMGADAPATKAGPPPSGEAAAKLMAGEWMLSKLEPSAEFESVSLVLEAGGRLTLEEVFKTEDGTLRITKKGKWWVKEGTAYGLFLESSRPDIAPVGYTTEDTILRLDDRIMELRTKEGRFERWEKNVG